MIEHHCDILEPELAQEIQARIHAQQFPWMHVDSTVGPADIDPEDVHVQERRQFVHPFIDAGDVVSEDADIVNCIVRGALQQLNVKHADVIRAKANLLLEDVNFPEHAYHPPHIDVVHEGVTTLIYYVDTVDGDTVIFDKTSNQGMNNLDIVHRQTPQANSILVFPSNQFHASSSPRTRVRHVVNIVARLAQ